MNISMRWNQLESDSKIEDYVISKIKPFENLLVSIIEAACELEKDTHHQSGLVYRFEVNLEVPGKVLRAEERGLTPYAAIDLVKDELHRHIKKYKETFETKQKEQGRELKEETHLSPLADKQKAKEYLDETENLMEE